MVFHLSPCPLCLKDPCLHSHCVDLPQIMLDILCQLCGIVVSAVAVTACCPAGVMFVSIPFFPSCLSILFCPSQSLSVTITH